jgi:hypothetical protein
LSYTVIFHKQFYFMFSGLNIMSYENPDNNLESLSIKWILKRQYV